MKTLFNNLDMVSQRIIVIAFSVSIILLSASVFVITATKSFAQQESDAKPVVGLGCDGSHVYYFDSNHQLKRRPKNTAKYDF